MIMTRINVYRTDDDGWQTREVLDGWFDTSTAECFEEDTRWDGHNMIPVVTNDQFLHENLWRTKGGRWVLHEWSQWEGTKDRWQFVGEGRAREWLIVNGRDDAVEQHFGPMEEERGPGRPEVGRAINVRIPEDVIARLGAIAANEGTTRAEVIRRIVSAGC